MKLGLGTVQFGLPYGIANRQGQPSIEAVKMILHQASIAGVQVLDTAPLYGESESVIGQLLSKDHHFNLVTKTPRFDKHQITPQDTTQLKTTFERSLQTLSQASIYGLLIHSSNDLCTQGGEYLWEQMQALKQAGQVEKIGVSVYSGQDIDAILNQYDIDIIQLPLSLFDQRLLKNGYLSALKNLGIEIHVRSAFLQGLLLMEPTDRPNFFTPLASHFSHYQEILHAYNTTPIAACLDFVNQQPEVDRIICGVDSLHQFTQIVTALNQSSSIPKDVFSTLSIDDECFLNPSLWK
jgi:aryl-alcohol dehydrogenase-like predicted oxidoreductase